MRSLANRVFTSVMIASVVLVVLTTSADAGEYSRRGVEVRVVPDAFTRPSEIAAVTTGDGIMLAWDAVVATAEGERRKLFLACLDDEGSVVCGPTEISTEGIGAGGSFPSLSGIEDRILLTWLSREPARIRGLLLDSEGRALGNAFTVNQASPSAPASAVFGNEFLVAWSGSDDGPGRSLHGRRVSADGELVGEEFVVSAGSAESGYFHERPSLADASPGQNAVAAWFVSDLGEFRARFVADEGPVGDVFIIFPDGGAGLSVEICSLSDGGFVAAWNSAALQALIYRKFDAFGEPIGPEVEGVDTMHPQYTPEVECMADGGFSVVWSTVDSLYGNIVVDGDISTFRVAIGIERTIAHPVLVSDTTGEMSLFWFDCEQRGGDSGDCLLSMQKYARGPGVCVGDCDLDGDVTVDELVFGVRVALQNSLPTALKSCLAFDSNLDYTLGIGELIFGVRNALGGCD